MLCSVTKEEDMSRPVKPIALVLAVTILSVLMQACAAAAPVATATPPPKPTNTAPPTSTPLPTATPNLAATARVEKLSELLTLFSDAFQVQLPAGAIREIQPAWQQMSGGSGASYWFYDDVLRDFLFSAHYAWEKTAEPAQSIGCNVSFGWQIEQDRNQYWEIYFDTSRLSVTWIEIPPGRGYSIGKTSGSGRVALGDATEADFALLVLSQHAYVSMNGEVTEYTLRDDWTTEGKLHLSQNSYGGVCEMADLMLWVPED
jgi:hypothetical protein